MSARRELAGKLQELFGDDYKVWAFDRDLGPIDAALSAVVLVDAPTYAPGGPAGALMLTFPIHVVTPYTDPEKVADQFDAVLDEMFSVLDRLDNIVWTDAKPSMFDEQKPSYAFTVTVLSKKE
jgi:hypothetical protein